jgi:hypothetical protein
MSFSAAWFHPWVGIFLKKAVISALLKDNFSEIVPMTHCLNQYFSPLAAKRKGVLFPVRKAASSFAPPGGLVFSRQPESFGGGQARVD